MGRMMIATIATTAAVGVLASEATAAPVIAPPLATTIGYAPRQVDSPRGTKVFFYNLDIVSHDVRSVTPGLFSSKVTGPGRVAINGTQFLARGNYKFFCTLHATTMRGTLRIT